MIIRDLAKPFEVAEADLPGTYTWGEWEKDLPDGWRVPNRLELLAMYLRKDEIGGSDTSGVYWSFSEGSSPYAWLQHFGSGYQYSYPTFYSCRVRAVRDVPEKSIDVLTGTEPWSEREIQTIIDDMCTEYDESSALYAPSFSCALERLRKTLRSFRKPKASPQWIPWHEEDEVPELPSKQHRYVCRWVGGGAEVFVNKKWTCNKLIDAYMILDCTPMPHSNTVCPICGQPAEMQTTTEPNGTKWYHYRCTGCQISTFKYSAKRDAERCFLDAVRRLGGEK